MITTHMIYMLLLGAWSGASYAILELHVIKPILERNIYE